MTERSLGENRELSDLEWLDREIKRLTNDELLIANQNVAAQLEQALEEDPVLPNNLRKKVKRSFKSLVDELINVRRQRQILRSTLALIVALGFLSTLWEKVDGDTGVVKLSDVVEGGDDIEPKSPNEVSHEPVSLRHSAISERINQQLAGEPVQDNAESSLEDEAPPRKNIISPEDRAVYERDLQERLAEAFDGLIPQEAFMLYVDSQHPITQEDLDQKVIPNLVNLRDVPEVTLVKDVMVHEVMVDDLRDLFLAAQEDGIDLRVLSGYRSIEEQTIIYDRTYDKSLVAFPGTSQHHTGLALDFTSPENKNTVNILTPFINTEAGRWMAKNAWKYGFVLSYTAGHDGIANEDWHYVYVGKYLAKQWHEIVMMRRWNTDIFLILDVYSRFMGIRDIQQPALQFTAPPLNMATIE